MTLKFTGTYDELKDLLKFLQEDGEWVDLNVNQKQFRHKLGPIINWYPSTGTINFQGKSKGLSEIESKVSDALVGKKSPPSDSKVKPPEDTQDVANEAPKEEISKSKVEIKKEINSYPTFLNDNFNESEIVIGLVGAVGTELNVVYDIIKSRLATFGYTTSELRISQEVIPKLIPIESGEHDNQYSRINDLMTAGNEARKLSDDNSILALGAAANIQFYRSETNKDDIPYKKRHAYVINSLKHPDEVIRLREIYSEGFYLIGVYSDEVRRRNFLSQDLNIYPTLADKLMTRDEDEHVPYGQRTSHTFHLSDFFIQIDENRDQTKKSLWRILDIIFGDPYKTPTFDEFAMFLAFSASLRSADLSRQVGAVLTKGDEIIATGANDCPKFGGGLYWPYYDHTENEIVDAEDGRDYKRGEDSNKIEKEKIIDDIINNIENLDIPKDEIRKALKKSRINDITEYGRVVHAEMEAILTCARNNISTRGSSIFCTTFPCHNCAKHIIAAGIERVVYIEPYPKSKAFEFHSDSIQYGFLPQADVSTSDTNETVNHVYFEPFVGIGPRRFFDLFSMRLGSGYPLKRKEKGGLTTEWDRGNSKLRIQMMPCSYIDIETLATNIFNQYRKELIK